MADKPALERDGASPDGRDYVLNANSVWITVKGFSVKLAKTDEGVLVDIYPKNKEDATAVASAYVFDGEEDADDTPEI